MLSNLYSEDDYESRKGLQSKTGQSLDRLDFNRNQGAFSASILHKAGIMRYAISPKWVVQILHSKNSLLVLSRWMTKSLAVLLAEKALHLASSAATNLRKSPGGLPRRILLIVTEQAEHAGTAPVQFGGQGHTD
jgi:hypothetical protein